MLYTNGLVTSLWHYWKVAKSLVRALEEILRSFLQQLCGEQLCSAIPRLQQAILPCVGPEQPGQMTVDYNF